MKMRKSAKERAVTRQVRAKLRQAKADMKKKKAKS